jgi:FkbM family methyltransferase
MSFRKLVKFWLSVVINLSSKTWVGGRILDQTLASAMSRIVRIRHRDTWMSFSVPNSLCRYRATSFSLKEPDTLVWLESMPSGTILWDVGANVGLYSVYAAKARGAKVYSFEPSVFNLELLARNISINDVGSSITIIPIALSNSSDVQNFKLTSVAWGSALSAFGVDFDQNGKALHPIFDYRLPGVRADDVVEMFSLELPEYLKIDVDGIEHLILEGGQEVLKSVQSVLIEVDENFQQQSSRVTKLLIEAGLSLTKKSKLDVNAQHNQWWTRT